MKTLKIIIPLLLAVFSTSASAAITNAQVFAYVQSNYPTLFPGTPTEATASGWDYQIYPITGNYIGINNGWSVAILGNNINGGALMTLGTVGTLTPAITQMVTTGALPLQGPQGLTGATGPQGSQGTAGTSAPVYIIGDQIQGGKVFWVDATGQHGLIAALADQNAGVQWYNGTYISTNATADGLYAGAKNTEVIISSQTSVGLACKLINSITCYTASDTTLANITGNFAALVAANYSIRADGVTTAGCAAPATATCYSDWYLPSAYELILLYREKTVVGGFANNYYWSSSEYASNSAWIEDFGYGSQGHYRKDQAYPVRAVRAF